MSWIEQGLLKATREETRTGKPIYSIEFEALQKFCKENRNLLITRRWPPHRIRFLEEYVFARSMRNYCGRVKASVRMMRSIVANT
jgi:hypothetical protein